VVRSDLARLDRRLRSLSVSAWRSRRASIDALLEELVALTGEVEGRPQPQLPALPEYALADAVSVLAGDVLVANSTSSIVERLTGEVRAALDATR
jgi:hypothetical protein